MPAAPKSTPRAPGQKPPSKNQENTGAQAPQDPAPADAPGQADLQDQLISQVKEAYAKGDFALAVRQVREALAGIKEQNFEANARRGDITFVMAMLNQKLHNNAQATQLTATAQALWARGNMRVSEQNKRMRELQKKFAAKGR
jgi:hypothetical protein